MQKGSSYVWRASLVQVGSGEQRNFASLEALFGYLEMVTRNTLETEEASTNGENELPPD